MKIGTFAADLFKGAIIGMGLSVIGFGIVSTMSAGLLFALSFLVDIDALRVVFLTLVYGGPIGVILFGAIKRRPGFAAGPLLFFALLAAYSYAVVVVELRSLEEANSRRLLPMTIKPTVIALELDTDFCLSICRQILATSNYAVAARPVSIGNYQHAWVLYQKATGGTCLEPDHRYSVVSFLRAGYVDTCAIVVSQRADINGALILRHYEFEPSILDPAVPASFVGHEAIVSEISDGKERVLGRWLSGRLKVPFRRFLLFASSQPESVGPEFLPEDVYSFVLGTPITVSEKPGPAEVDELLARLEQLGDSPKVRMGISDAYFELLKSTNDQVKIQNRLKLLLLSDEPDRFNLGLKGLWPLHLDLDLTGAEVEKLIGRSDDVPVKWLYVYARMLQKHLSSEQRQKWALLLLQRSAKTPQEMDVLQQARDVLSSPPKAN